MLLEINWSWFVWSRNGENKNDVNYGRLDFFSAKDNGCLSTRVHHHETSIKKIKCVRRREKRKHTQKQTSAIFFFRKQQKMFEKTMERTKNRY